MGHIYLIICSGGSVLGGRRCWWRFSPIFHCFCCSFVMCPLGKACLKCRREALTDIFSVCAGHLLLSTRPSVNPPLSHDRFTATSLSPDRVIPPPPKKITLKKKKKKRHSKKVVMWTLPPVVRPEVRLGKASERRQALITHWLRAEPGKFIRGGFMWRRQFDKNPYEVRLSEAGRD